MLILVLLIFSVMIVVGTLLINRVSSYFLDEFSTQMEEVFTQRFLAELSSACADELAPDRLREMLDAYERLRDRLGVVDEDEDVEVVIDSLLDIQRQLCLKMFELAGIIL